MASGSHASRRGCCRWRSVTFSFDGGPRDGPADLMGGPEMAPHTPPSERRSSRELDRASDAGRWLDRGGASAGPIITEPHVHVPDPEPVGPGGEVPGPTAEGRRW